MLKLCFLLLFMQVAYASEKREVIGENSTEVQKFFLVKTGNAPVVSVVMGSYSDKETGLLLGTRVFTASDKEGMDIQLAAYKLDASVAINSDIKLKGLSDFFHKAGAPEKEIKELVQCAQFRVQAAESLLASPELCAAYLACIPDEASDGE